jgi:Chitobiase/beta-hexosaminidase C-terminal domain
MRVAKLPGVALVSILLAVGCGPDNPVVAPDAGTPAPVPAVTSLSPDPGPFNGAIEVTLTTDAPATLFVTTDGSDPKVDGPARKSGESSVTLTLSDTATLTFFSRTAEGAEEAVRTAEYFRAGGPAGTLSGVVVVDTVAVGHQVALFVDGTLRELGTPTEPKELPFTIDGLTSGTHRIRAMADRNDDGTFLPVVDLESDVHSFELDLENPLRASVENVRIHLGSSSPGLCTLRGTIELPKPSQGELLRVSAINSEVLSGGGIDPSQLLAQLQDGDPFIVSESQTEYPYVLTDLAPGSYVPAPLLTSFGAGGLSMNLIANPLKAVACGADEVETADLRFGPVALSGTVTVQPSTAPQGVVWGIIAAKGISLTEGLQAVLIPVFFTPVPGGADLNGGFAGSALRSNTQFGLRLFSSIDSQNPLADALMWTLTPFGAAPTHAQVVTTNADVKVDFTVQLP